MDASTGLRTAFRRVLVSYESAKRTSIKGHPVANTIRNEIPALIIDVLGQDALGLRVKGSSGQGRWADTPWIAIMDPTVASSPQRGYYVAYLFAGSMKRLVLSLNQGIAGESPEMLRPNAELIRSKVPQFRTAFSDGPITLDVSYPGAPATYYEAGHAFGKTYDVSLPAELELIEDLRQMVRLYRTLARRRVTL
ncbi:MAG TPA: DUF3578 domain-containing protein [Bryobacteraceae bacterium]|nr:DUF3578 domain-containing protein [Bryobacteraceae bacterium]